MIELPWSKKTEEEINLDKSLEILNEDHFDLRKSKRENLEYLAVKSLERKSNEGSYYLFQWTSRC